jgi:hypothetical protein
VCGHVDGIDVRRVDDGVGIVVGALDAVAPRKIGGELAVSAHDGDQF